MPISRYYDVKRDEKGERYLEPYVTGFLLLRLPLLNKGTAFDERERDELGLRGLLPARITTIEDQLRRALYAARVSPYHGRAIFQLCEEERRRSFIAGLKACADMLIGCRTG